MIRKESPSVENAPISQKSIGILQLFLKSTIPALLCVHHFDCMKFSELVVKTDLFRALQPP